MNFNASKQPSEITPHPDYQQTMPGAKIPLEAIPTETNGSAKLYRIIPNAPLPPNAETELVDGYYLTLKQVVDLAGAICDESGEHRFTASQLDGVLEWADRALVRHGLLQWFFGGGVNIKLRQDGEVQFMLADKALKTDTA